MTPERETTSAALSEEELAFLSRMERAAVDEFGQSAENFVWVKMMRRLRADPHWGRNAPAYVERKGAAQLLAQYADERDRAQQELQSIFRSRSWRLVTLMRRTYGALVSPKRVARRVLEIALNWSRQHPRLKYRIAWLAHFVPPLERRLLAFAQARGFAANWALAPAEPLWAIQPDANVQSDWDELLATMPGAGRAN